MCQKVTISTGKESYIINTTKVVVKFSKQKLRLKVHLHKYFFHIRTEILQSWICVPPVIKRDEKQRFCCWISLCPCSRAAFSALQNLPGRSASKSSPNVTLSHIQEQLNSRPSLKGLPAPAALSVLKFNISPLVLKLQTRYLPFWLVIKVVKEQNQCPLSQQQTFSLTKLVRENVQMRKDT